MKEVVSNDWGYNLFRILGDNFIYVIDKKQRWDIFPPTTINTNIFRDFFIQKKCMCIFQYLE